MKKRGLAVLALAAMMTFGTTGISAMAAEGWAQEGGNWVYYDNSGSRIYNAWRKGGDGLWRYLNGNGVMAISSWVDNDDYYVGQDGIMMTNQWLETESNRYSGATDWYYFGQSGKRVREKWEKINDKWYHFVHEIANGSLRLTLSEDTTMEEADYTADSLKGIVERLRSMSPLYEDFVKNQK